MPPCFIIVCQNTAISKLVYDFIAGFNRKNDDGTTTPEDGQLALFRNFDDTTGNPLPRPNTLLITANLEAIVSARDRRELKVSSEQDFVRFARNKPFLKTPST